MPGPRYDGWHHLRYVGDRALAAQHLPLARKVLGFVQEQAAVNGLQTYKHVVEIEGGMVVGELIGGVPRVTVVVQPAGKREKGPSVEGFVVRLSNDLVAGGTQLDPLVLQPPGSPEDDPRWGALFYNGDSYGFDGTDEDLRGTYSHVFGPRSLLPKELGAGPIWVSRDDEVVSWFRGFPAYWPHHYTHPGASYSGYVTIYGHTVFTVPDANMRVMAAAARDGHLFVLIASGLWELPSPTPPAPATCGDVWASQPYANLFHVYRLYRLPLSVEINVRGVQVYKAAALADGELLADVPLQRAYGAWSFNRDVTRLVSIQLPEKAVMYTPTKYDTDPTWGPFYAPNYDAADAGMPTAGNQRFEIALTHAPTGVSAAFTQAAAGSVVAEEDDVQLELVDDGSFFDGTAQINYKCGDWELLASRTYSGTYLGEPVRNAERNVLLYAHLPTRTFVFHHAEYTLNPPPRSVRTKYRVFRPDTTGAIAEIAGADPTPQEFDAPPSLALDCLLAGMPSVMGVGRVNGTGDDWAWFRPWDGVTTLLTLRYDRDFTTFDDAAPPGAPQITWYPIWAGPLIGFQRTVGARYGAGGVYFGSTSFSGPWTWDWALGSEDGVSKRIYFNGVRIDAVDAIVSDTYFGGSTGCVHDDRQGTLDALCIADEAPAAALARVTFSDDEDELLDALEVRRPLRWAVVGDPAPTLAGVIAELPTDRPLGRSIVLGHTGKPQPEQRGGIEKA